MSRIYIWFEIRNLFVMNERRGRIDSARADQALALLGGLPIEVDRGSEPDALTAIARRYRLTVYDAAYLELAHRRALPLASLDEAMRAAGRKLGIVLVGDSDKG